MTTSDGIPPAIAHGPGEESLTSAPAVVRSRALKIREVVIDPPVLPAPMCGISDRAWRVLAREQGCTFTYTQMASCQAIDYNDQKTWDILDVAGEEADGPVGIQLFGHEPDRLGRAASKVESAGAAIVDLNMGCPAQKVVASMGGSALMRHPDLVREIFRAMRRALRVPFTVKIRAGWDKYGDEAFAIGHIAEQEGVDAIAIHARTRAQAFKGKSDWTLIRALKEKLSIPVIGNGDIVTPEDGVRMIEQTGCDGIMIGRGIMGNPWLLGRTIALLQGRELPPLPSPSERIAMMLRHARLMAERRGEQRGLREFRKHAVQYLKGLPGSHTIKQGLMNTLSLDELTRLLTFALERAETLRPELAAGEADREELSD